MQSHRHAMRANLSPFPRLATVAEILNVYRALDHHRGAERNLAPLHHPAQQRWRPVGTEHFALLQVSACPFHHIPTGGGAEQGFCEFNWHSTQYGSGMSHYSRTQGRGALDTATNRRLDLPLLLWRRGSGRGGRHVGKPLIPSSAGLL